MTSPAGLPRTKSGEPSYPLAKSLIRQRFLEIQEEYGLTDIEMLDLLADGQRQILRDLVSDEQGRNNER